MACGDGLAKIYVPGGCSGMSARPTLMGVLVVYGKTAVGTRTGVAKVALTLLVFDKECIVSFFLTTAMLLMC